MNLTRKEYSLESFLEEIADNPDSISSDADQRNWLKVYLMIADDDWKDLFKRYKPEKMGDIYQFKMPFGDRGNYVDYFLHELENGLLMFFTSSKREEYARTLRHFVRKHHGITEMWLPPSSFESVISYVISNYSANIYSFTARRTWSSKYPAKIREDFSRLIHYSGDDAGYSLKEMKEMYGVLPTLIDFNINGDKMRISNEGLFLLRSINRKTLRIVLEIVDRVLAEQRRLRSVSKQVTHRTNPIKVGDHQMMVATLMSGKIMFSTNLDTYLVDKLFNSFYDEGFGHTEEGLELPNFSFIDTNIREGSVTFSATVIDEDKGTIFGISGNENSMILIPKHNTTFESFLNFFRLINQTMDESSNIQLFSEGIVSR